MNWLISANSSMYDHAKSFADFNFIDWRQGKTKYNVNDIVFIYCSAPIQKIQYKCLVEKIDLTANQTRDDLDYWKDKSGYYGYLDGKFMRLRLIEQVFNDNLGLNALINQGLKSAPQGPQKISGILLNHIEKCFIDDNNNIFPDVLHENLVMFEGLKKVVSVNKYERNSFARQKCIEHNGDSCEICKISFEDKYGKIGKGFIHVHHVVPIHKIGKEYKIDYKKDLIPVCPNCHAMLHQKINGQEISVEQLKQIVKRTK